MSEKGVLHPGGDKIFVIGGEGSDGISMKASLDIQADLLDLDPETFSKAPYVGRYGWVTAEVTDESRRTIVGVGDVLVSRKPFRVFTWVDRGHYRTGDEVAVEIERVGGERTIKVDVRIVAATNADLRALIKARIAEGRHRNWLIFGERSVAHDRFYGDELEQWRAAKTAASEAIVALRSPGTPSTLAPSDPCNTCST